MAVENDNIEMVKQLLSYSNIDINSKLSIRNKNTQELIKEYTVLQLVVIIMLFSYVFSKNYFFLIKLTEIHKWRLGKSENSFFCEVHF